MTSILESEHILSPRVTKAKRKRIKKELAEAQKAAKTKKEAVKIQQNLVAIEDAHSRRPKSAYFGELEQMDASPYEWFGGKKTTLHIAVDDATGIITGAYFDEQETLNGYYHIYHQILTNYGIPYKFFTDRRTVFTYKKKNSPDIEDDTCKRGVHGPLRVTFASEDRISDVSDKDEKGRRDEDIRVVRSQFRQDFIRSHGFIDIAHKRNKDQKHKTAEDVGILAGLC